MQYFITYVLGHQSLSGKKAVQGTVVHKVLEVLAGLKNFDQENIRVRILKVDDDAIGKFKCSKTEFNTYEIIDTIL